MRVAQAQVYLKLDDSYNSGVSRRVVDQRLARTLLRSADKSVWNPFTFSV